jgi:hypothetical protein
MEVEVRPVAAWVVQLRRGEEEREARFRVGEAWLGVGLALAAEEGWQVVGKRIEE